MKMIERLCIEISLKSYSRAKIGPIEKTALRWVAKADSGADLPKSSSESDWKTAFIASEISSCWETISKKAVKIDLKLTKHYVKALELAEKISHIQTNAEKILNSMPLPLNDNDLQTRKLGEEELDIEMIRKRRLREYETQRALIQKKADTILAETIDDMQMLSHEKNYLEEYENLMDEYINRTMNHSRQRIDTYWAALYRFSKGKPGMPAFYDHNELNVGGISYRKLHEKEHELISKVLNKYNKEDAA